MRSPGAIIIGGYINGLGLVRALAARNIPVAVITTEPYDIAHRSRYVVAHASAAGLDEQPELLVELLDRRAAEWPGWALFPTNDGALAALSMHHDRLASKYRIIAPLFEIVRYFLDKELMLGAARGIGMDVPHCYGAAVHAHAALADLRFPVLVKPYAGHMFFSHFGCKLFTARNHEDLGRCISQVENAKIPCGIFDFIPGPDSRIYAYCLYIDQNGEPGPGLLVRKLRQSPPFFGVARVAEVAGDHPELRTATIELLRRIGYCGMVSAEFKLDPRDNTFRFMEVNGRSVIYNGLLRKAGLDLGGLAWSDCVERRPERARPNGWPGVWINLHADLLYSTFYRRLGRVSFGDFLRPYARPKIDAVRTVRDPAPSMVQWSRTAREGTSALLRCRFRKLIAQRIHPLSCIGSESAGGRRLA